MNPFPPMLAASLLLAAGALAQPTTPTPSLVPSPAAMATQPDARDYITRADSTLLQGGQPLRFGGINVSWLALRDDTGRPADARLPTPFELQDTLDTVQKMGAGYIRVLSLGVSADCALCIAPALGQLNPDALKQSDHLLRLARDAGLKLIIPLAGPGGACGVTGVFDPNLDTACIFAHWRGKPGTDFYTDAQLRADFADTVTALLRHVNPETGIAYKDDPTIMAWENCDGCGAQTAPRVLADWTEFLGQTIKAVDTHHLYENGAFAGRLGKQIGMVGPELLTLPSVDIVGDRVAPAPGAAPTVFLDALSAVTSAGRVYLIDDYAWLPAQFSELADLDAFQAALVKKRTLTGAFAGDLAGHADQGGYLPPARPHLPTLYFPGTASEGLDADAMQARARAVRRLSYRMMDLAPIAFAQVDPPEILSAVHGALRWRGAAGALKYSIERTTDVTVAGSWERVCDQCVTDADPTWQDKSLPAGPVWYRMTPVNANAHTGLPSAPVQDK